MLAQDLATELGCKYLQPHVSRFPDGECYVRIEEENMDDEVVMVQNSHPDTQSGRAVVAAGRGHRTGGEEGDHRGPVLRVRPAG